MKTTKLVVGILMIVLSFIIGFQGMAAGILNAFADKGATSGSAGILMAIAYMVSGIVYLATQSKQGLGGDIANAIILGLFGFIAIFNANKLFGDLIVWIILGFLIGFGFLIWHVIKNKSIQKKVQNTSQQNNFYMQNQSSHYPSRAQYRAMHRH